MRLHSSISSCFRACSPDPPPPKPAGATNFDRKRGKFAPATQFLQFDALCNAVHFVCWCPKHTHTSTHTPECVSKSRNTLPKFLENGSKISHSHPANTHHLFARTWLKPAQVNPQPTSPGSKVYQSGGRVCLWSRRAWWLWVDDKDDAFLSTLPGAVFWVIIIVVVVSVCRDCRPTNSSISCVCVSFHLISSIMGSIIMASLSNDQLFPTVFAHTHTPHTPFTLSAFHPPFRRDEVCGRVFPPLASGVALRVRFLG